MDLNFNNVTVNSNGSVSFSGLASGIDFQATVQAIIDAKRIPITNLETRVSTNTDEINSYSVLRTGLTTLRDSLKALYGAVSIDSSKDAFAAKGAVLATSRSDGGTASAAGNLLGISVTNAAAAGTHKLEILQTAKAHQVSSAAQGSTGTALGVSGDFTVNGVSVTLSSSDTLADIRDRINAANSTSKVTASIVTVGASENFLVLTADDTGDNIALADTSGTPLESLGIITGGGAIANELQAAKKAQFHADGLRDKTVAYYESTVQTADTSPVTAGGVGTAGTLEFFDASNASITTLAYNADDSITALATAINGDTTLSGAGIRAEVVQDVDGFRLEISGTAAFRLTDTGSAVADLGLAYEQGSDLKASASTTVAATGTLTFSQIGGAGLGAVAYSAGQSLTTIAANITSSITNVTATVVQDGSGSRLEITGSSGVAFTISDDSTLTTELGLYDKELLVERTTNTVSDLFAGVTLNLFTAEEGTEIAIDIQQDLTSIKDEITAFVTAYNELKVFINDQTFIDPATGAAGENATLVNSSTIKSVEQQLNDVLGFGASGENLALTILSEIGIDFVDNSEVSDPLFADTLEIDEAALDAALLSKADQIQDLFGFSYTSSDPRVVLLSFNGNTQPQTGGYTLNIDYDDGASEVGEANIGGAGAGTDDGTVSVGTGSIMTVTDQSTAEGLTLLYTGTSDISGVTIDVSVGIGAQMFFAIDDMLDPVTGSVEQQIETLDDQNTFSQTRIDQMLTRLENERVNLLERFVRLEAILAQLEQVRLRIEQTTEAMFQNS